MNVSSFNMKKKKNNENNDTKIIFNNNNIDEELNNTILSTTKYDICCLCTNSKLDKKNITEMESNNIILCTICNNYQHTYCISPSHNCFPYICYLCQINSYDFFSKRIQRILNPIKFETNTINNTSNSKSALKNTVKGIFKLNLNQIKNNQFLLFHIYKFSERGYIFEIPHGITITLNNKKILENNFIDHKKYYPLIFIGNEYNTFHYFKKIIGNIHDFFNYKNTNVNYLNITIQINEKYKNCNNKYIIYCDLVENLETQKIMNNIKCYNDVNIIKGFLEEKNKLNINENIFFTDCYSQIDYITLPARGLYCKHLSVFDFNKYLAVDKISRRYTCPICMKKLGIPYIDMKMKEIFEDCYKKMKEEKIKFVGIVMNCDYQVVKKIEEEIKINNNNNGDNNDEDDDDEDSVMTGENIYGYISNTNNNNIDDIDKEFENFFNNNNKNKNNNNINNKKNDKNNNNNNKEDVINLIDDEDEEEKNIQNNNNNNINKKIEMEFNYSIGIIKSNDKNFNNQKNNKMDIENDKNNNSLKNSKDDENDNFLIDINKPFFWLEKDFLKKMYIDDI